MILINLSKTFYCYTYPFTNYMDDDDNEHKRLFKLSPYAH